MIEKLIATFFQRHINSIAGNRFFHRFVNSEVAYWLLAWQVSKYTRLLQNPTNEKTLTSLSRLEKIAGYLIPDGDERIYETDIIHTLKGGFKSAIKTGSDTNLTRKANRALGLMGARYLRTLLLYFGAINLGVGKLNRYFKKGEPYFNYLVLQPNSDCNALAALLGKARADWITGHWTAS